MDLGDYNLCDYNGYDWLPDDDDDSDDVYEARNRAYEEAQRNGSWLKLADDAELNLHLHEPISMSTTASESSDSEPDLEPEEPQPETREQRIRRTHGRLRWETPLIQPLRRLAWAKATHSMLGGALLPTDLIELVAASYTDVVRAGGPGRQPLREAIGVSHRSMPDSAGGESVRNYVTETAEMRHIFQGYMETSHEVNTEKHNSATWTLNFVKTVVRHLESPQRWAAFVAGIDPTVSFELHMHHMLDSTSGSDDWNDNPVSAPAVCALRLGVLP